MTECGQCGAKAWSWLAGSMKHKQCPATFLRRSFIPGQGWLEVPEPHTAAEWEEIYLIRGLSGHDYTLVRT